MGDIANAIRYPWNKIITAFQLVRPGNIGTLLKYISKDFYFFEFHFKLLINTFFRLILKIDEIFPDAFFPTLIIGNPGCCHLAFSGIIFFFSRQCKFSPTF